MAAQAQLDPQAPSPTPEPALAPSQRNTAELNAQGDAKRREILEAARANVKKLTAEWRAAEGLPAPTPAAPAPSAPATTPATPAPTSTTGLAEALAATLEAKMADATRARVDADRIKAEAEKRATDAEAALKNFKLNPAAYLAAEGINLDQWNARLANGGEATPEEKLRAEVDTRVRAAEERAAKAENLVNQHFVAEKREKAVAELQPVLAKDYPMVDWLLGPEQTLEALATESRRQGRAVNPEQFLATLEERFLTQQRAGLQRQSVATKLGLSVKSPQAEVVAQSPQTLTNRVTSTVSPQSTRPASDRDRIARGRELARKLIAAGQL